MSQGYEVCLLLIHSRQQLRSRAGKYWREIKTKGREGRLRTKGCEKKDNTEEKLKTDEDPHHLKSNLYNCFRMRQSNWGNKQGNKEKEYVINILLH